MPDAAFPIDQQAYWNGAAGSAWTSLQDSLDITFAPVLDELLHRAALRPGERVLDIGCGCGASTIAAAARVAPSGHCTGVDLSAEMLARARHRVPLGLPASFFLADATGHAFENGATDVVISRFGVMFFERPVEAFTNLYRALTPGGRMVFACWRAARENPYFVLPLREACKHVPRLPDPRPDEPGPFAFAEPERVRSVLCDAGFSSIDIAPFDTELDAGAGRGPAHATDMALAIGPASRALKDQPADKAAAARADILRTLQSRARGTEVPLAAAIWIVAAVKR